MRKIEGAGSLSLKRGVGDLLRSDDFENRLPELLDLPARQVVNPLFAFLCSPLEILKWRAVRAMGAVVSRLADEDPEAARVIMRRLMWSLNDESGGIGWGAPEAMGEIMASHAGLRKEYANILLSYIRKDGNPLEHRLLERGVLWSIGKVAEATPELFRGSSVHLMPYLGSEDAEARGLAAWATGFLGEARDRERLRPLLDDRTEINIFLHDHLHRSRVCDLAAEAIERIPQEPVL